MNTTRETKPTPLPMMAAILALCAECGAALERAAMLCSRVEEIAHLTTASLRAAELLEALRVRERAAPAHFAKAVERARQLCDYLKHFLTRPLNMMMVIGLSVVVETAAREALETDEQEESEVVVPWGADLEIAARVYWTQGGPRVSIEGGRCGGDKLGIGEAEAIVGRGRGVFDRMAVSAAGSPVGV